MYDPHSKATNRNKRFDLRLLHCKEFVVTKTARFRALMQFVLCSSFKQICSVLKLISFGSFISVLSTILCR